MDRNLDENMLLLVELYCRKGHVNDAMFGNNETKKQDFLNANGLRIFADDYKKAVDSFNRAMNAQDMINAKTKVNEVAQRIRQQVRTNLLTKGIDLEAIYGKEPSLEDAKKMLYRQLEELGMDKQTIESMGLEGIEQILHEGGRSFEFSVNDTEQARNAFNRQGVEYESRDGRLHAKGKVAANEGVAIDDTPQNRRLLDENEIEYIDMAMNINPKLRKAVLFVPSTWKAPIKEQMKNDIAEAFNMVVNDHYCRNFFKIAAFFTVGIALPIHPAFTVAAFLILRKAGMLDRKQRDVAPTNFEKKALQAGHTVYKEQKVNGRIKGQYLYMHEGNIMRINAADIRIPDYIKGVHLNPLQREEFRKGEPITLKNDRGEEFYARIDITNPNLYREYYKEMRSDRTTKPVPNTQSTDQEKLEYIAKNGLKGIRTIYGPANVNVNRDAFLMRYNLKDKFMEMIETEEKLRNTQDATLKDKYKSTMQKDNKSLCEIAENELISLHRSNSRKL